MSAQTITTTTTTNNENNSSSNNNYRFVDIGANLLDERFTEGSYHGKVRHPPDFDEVIQRATNVGMRHMVLTAGTLDDSRNAVAKVRQWRRDHNNNPTLTTSDDDDSNHCQLYCTVGVHPTRCLEFEQNSSSSSSSSSSPQENFQQLLEIAKDGMTDGTVVAIGEIGLDYDRLQFCPKDVQQTYFQQQLTLAQETGLPLFLHNRNVGSELYDVLLQNQDKWQSGGGVVHSFDDTAEMAALFTQDLGLYIGLNGCSLKTAQNLEVVKTLPLDRILLETDCPYCDVKKTHSGYQFVQTHFESRSDKKFEHGLTVKGRNEPCHIVQVAEVIAGVRGITVQELAEACYANSLRLYGWKE